MSATASRAIELRDAVSSVMDAHENWRASTLNLIASENVLSPAVRAALGNDLLARYADYTGRDLTARRYRGTRYVVELEELACELASEAFGAEHVDLRPIAGHLAGAAVLMAVCTPGDLVLEIGRDGGGHREAAKFGAERLTHLDVEFLPFDPSRYNVDVTAAIERIRERRPRVVILGSSNFLFPHPVFELAEEVHRIPGSRLVFDGSHVMGLLASGRFQDPLREGADIVFGSTHKTFPGPQGGIVFSNDSELMNAVSDALYPAIVTNHHPFRMPGLALALVEILTWGAEYSDTIVANSQALGVALAGRGIACVSDGDRYSASHTLLMRIAEFGTSDQVAARLEQAGIISTGAYLPPELGGEGIRIGTQELTRRGYTPADMDAVAALIARALDPAAVPSEVWRDVAALTASHQSIAFTWS